ncbi:hypothetical protein GCM10010245_87160 [Streptomyces spectabilis]|nr:hypothetical protein GCM10010245_87160 [Streptomyces spectabilis]
MDTACSSSLSAVYLACQAMRSGGCEQALAGGANLILTPYDSIPFAAAGSLSPDGRCKFGDESADGYVRSEAVGLVPLKPLDRALADGHRVRAVILGSATNNDGFTGTGMAAPDEESQAELLRARGPAWTSARRGGVRRGARDGHGPGRSRRAVRAEPGAPSARGTRTVCGGLGQDLRGAQ